LKKKFCSFKDAKKYVHTLKIYSQKEWRIFCKENKIPSYIPKSPDSSYKNEFKGWGDWLGTGRMASFNLNFLSFEDAKTFVLQLKLKNHNEWIKYCKSGNKPDDIPTTPWRIYKNKGWISFGDWLGTGTIAPQKRQYRSFEDARSFVHSLGFESRKDWDNYSKSNKKPTPRFIFLRDCNL
jgi:hypothetical protein